ncbi:MAG: putative Na+/H+ antiporter [Verrucomicrobiota bacterium]
MCNRLLGLSLLAVVLWSPAAGSTYLPPRDGEPQPAAGEVFPLPLDGYGEAEAGQGVWAVLTGRVRAEPFNLVVSLIFLAAITHTFMTPRFRHWAHLVEGRHAARMMARGEAVPTTDNNEDGRPDEVSFGGQVLHFFGEVEAVFGLWVVVLLAVFTQVKGWASVLVYLDHGVTYTEPMFVVVIMAIASTRPVLRFAENCVRILARLGRGTVAAWWLAILIVGPLLGSFITEPAAMTIAALLLARRFYELKPSPRFAYATLGLLFVNVSVGGTLTNFAAPPVLMVADVWGWSTGHMLTNFGWKAAAGIVVATLVYYVIFRREFAELQLRAAAREQAGGAPGQGRPIPAWITAAQLSFLAWTVFVSHHPELFIGSFLFFLGFTQATAHHQRPLELRGPLLVGFFLAGLVIHGGLQAWWIEPVLKSLGELPLFLGATVLTGFNDNAAITYLATLVPGFTESLKYAVVAGAVTGGGLTVIANAPNPAGQSILQRYFHHGVSPLGLLAGAIGPTVIMALFFCLT